MSYTIKNLEAFCIFVQEQVDAGSNVADAIQMFRDAQPKTPSEGEGVIIVLNYGPKSHAIFGADTKGVKDGLMALNTPGKKDVVSFNSKLDFGAGWVITNKTKLATVQDFLDENEISHTEIERDAFVSGEAPSVESAPSAPKKKASKTAKTSAPKAKVASKTAPKVAAKKAKTSPVMEENPEEEATDLQSMTLQQLKAIAKEAGITTTGTKDVLIQRIEKHRTGETSSKTKTSSKSKSKAVEKKTKAAPKAKAVADGPIKVVARKNGNENFVEEETGLVFLEAPVGSGGRKVKLAVGVQNTESEEIGLASVFPLDEDMIAICEERKWQYLTDDMMEIIAKKDADLHEQLTSLVQGSSTKNDEEENEGSNEEVEGSDEE